MNRLLIAGIGLLSLSAAALGAVEELGYSPDGGLVSFGEFDYVYDSASRLTEVWSNGAKAVENRYDALGRRVMNAIGSNAIGSDPFGGVGSGGVSGIML